LFDVDKNEFLSRSNVEFLISKTTIKQVPIIYKGITTLDNLKNLATQSQSNYYNGIVEGIYVRYSDETKLISRGKIVRSDFISGNEHWLKNSITVNSLL
jgi:atypical dual specificity phosphatase